MIVGYVIVDHDVVECEIKDDKMTILGKEVKDAEYLPYFDNEYEAKKHLDSINEFEVGDKVFVIGNIGLTEVKKATIIEDLEVWDDGKGFFIHTFKIMYEDDQKVASVFQKRLFYNEKDAWKHIMRCCIKERNDYEKLLESSKLKIDIVSTHINDLIKEDLRKYINSN